MLEKDSIAITRGQLIATLLSGSWRSAQPALSFDGSSLDIATPLLYGSGAGALGWWRIRETELRETPSAQVLHQAYRLQALQARIHETKIQKTFRLLRAAKVDSMLIKGWAISRLYPQAGLRPFGDIDVFVRRADYEAAKTVIDGDEAKDCWVDLHDHLSELADRSEDDLFSRSNIVVCGDQPVRVLSDEDHFALLAIHLLKHGAWRPLWLCDLGILLESMPRTFDWKLCLGRTRRRANWIFSAIHLAHFLLDATIRDPAIAERSRQSPTWLARSVLKQWESPFAIKQPPMSHRAPMSTYLRNPAGLFGDLANRWPNPILATVSVNGQFNRLPRLPYQVGNLMARAGQFLFRVSNTRRQLF